MKKTFKRQNKTLNRKSKKRTMKVMKGGAKVKQTQPDGSGYGKQGRSFGGPGKPDGSGYEKSFDSEHGIKPVDVSIKPSIESNKYSTNIRELEEKIIDTEKIMYGLSNIDRKINEVLKDLQNRSLSNEKKNFKSAQLKTLQLRRDSQRIEAIKGPSIEDMQAKLTALKKKQKAKQKLSNAAAQNIIAKTLGLLKNK